jgi:hypothetical protein
MGVLRFRKNRQGDRGTSSVPWTARTRRNLLEAPPPKAALPCSQKTFNPAQARRLFQVTAFPASGLAAGIKSTPRANHFNRTAELRKLLQYSRLQRNLSES